jgi:hypothetical protein
MSKLTIDTNAPKAVQTQVPQASEQATDGKDAALAAIIEQLSGQAPTASQVAVLRARLEERKVHTESLKSSSTAHAHQAGADKLGQVGSSQSGAAMVGATDGAQTLSSQERQNITNLKQGAILPRPASQAVSQDGAGEILERLGHGEEGWRSNFDGSAWGAALWSYMKNATQDDHAWRRMLKDLAASDSKLQEGFKELEIALTQLKQSQERHDKMLDLAQSGSKFSEKIMENKAQELVGNNPMKGAQKDGVDSLDDQEASPDSINQIRAIDDNLSKLTAEAAGRTDTDLPVRFLKPSELATLSDADQKAYADLHDQRYVLGGMTEKVATLRQDMRRRGFDPLDKSEPSGKGESLKGGEVEIAPDSATQPAGAMDDELRNMLNDADNKFKVQVGAILRDPRGYAMIRQNRSELARRVDQQTGSVETINKSIADKESALETAPEAEKEKLGTELAKLKKEQVVLVDQQEVMLDALVTLDDMMISNRPGIATAGFVKDTDNILESRAQDLAKRESGQDYHQKVTTIFTDMIRGAGSARVQANYPKTQQLESDAAGSKVLSDEDKSTMRGLAVADKSAEQSERISAMKARAEAGRSFHSSDAELFTSYHSEGAMQQFAKGALQSAVSTWERSAMKQVAEAGGQFGQAQKETYGMLQKTLGKIQQLVEQLINLQKL